MRILCALMKPDLGTFGARQRRIRYPPRRRMLVPGGCWLRLFKANPLPRLRYVPTAPLVVIAVGKSAARST